jgi:orotate phosphoribosyltransferase
MSLFNFGGVHKLSSGKRSPFKIDCDFLSYDDLRSLADLSLCRLKPFFAVEAIPRGGTRLAFLMIDYCQEEGGLLIVDDVYTTGRSMEKKRAGREAQGLVIFARAPTPAWVVALFQMPNDVTGDEALELGRRLG